MLIETLGIIFILFSSSYLGFYYSNRLKNRVASLEKVCYMTDAISTQIRYRATNLFEVMEFLKRDSICKEIDFVKNFDSKKEGIFSKKWESSLNKNKKDFNSDDVNLLKALGNILGTTDIEGQLNELSAFKVSLYGQLKIAKNSYEKKSKLYRSLGVILGAFIAIMLI